MSGAVEYLWASVALIAGTAGPSFPQSAPQSAGGAWSSVAMHAVAPRGAPRGDVSHVDVVRDTGITTDTGDFAPRPRAYANYATPFTCIVAAANAQQFAEHARAVRILQDANFTRPEADTLPTAAIAVARACGARFTLNTTTPDDLPDLFTLALWESNDTLAQTVLATLLTHATTPKARGDQLLWALKQYLDVRPARVATAEAIAAQIDALGASAWNTRVDAHQALVNFARDYAEWPVIMRHGELLIALIRDQLSATWLPVLWQTYQAQLTVAWLDQPDSMMAVATRFRTEFSRPEVQHAVHAVCSSAKGSWGLSGACDGVAHLPTADSTALATFATAMLGIDMPRPQALPPLRADYWFPPPAGTVGGDSLHPAVHGRVTLIYNMDDKGCWQGCASVTDQLQALLARYGSSLAVTIVMEAAAGYTTLAVPATPDTVAQSYRWLFQQYLGLPVAVAVRIRRVDAQLPPPDGRIRYARSSTYHDLYEGSNGSVLVTNRSGQLVYRGLTLTSDAGRYQLAKVVAHEEAVR